jgi:hypothetical protein
MGTRNLTCVWIDGAFKVAQYGQWDGYPGGVGSDILTFLKGVSLDALKQAARACRWATKDEIEATWLEAGMKKGDEFVDMKVAGRHSANYPELSRDTGAKILPLIMSGPHALSDNHAFAADGLFCEWAYVIDLDAMTLEVYQGFNKSPGKDHGKFTGIPKEKGCNEKYTPVVLVKTYPLADLPELDAFVSECDPEEVEA